MSTPLPTLDGRPNAASAQLITQEQRAKLDKIINAPSTIGGWSLLGKMMLGVIVGAIMSVALFFIMSLFGLTLQGSANMASGVGMSSSVHPLAWLILLFLGLIVTV